jgi:glycosyltransferase involved in cell wall biosynthesis
MNVLLLMGRGIEGTGNTRITIETHEFLKSKGHNVTTLANCEKAWGRKKSQENEIKEFNFKKEEYDGPLNYDLCLIFSIPAKNFSDEGKENFTKMLEKLTCKKIYLQVDHKIHSINRNYFADDNYRDRFFNSLSKIITHDKRNDFAVYLERNHISVPVDEQLMISCDFDDIKSKINVTNKIDKLAYFIGRSARWKGFSVFRDMHHLYLKNLGFCSIMEGIELSIGYLDEFFASLKPERLARNDVELLFKDEPNLHANGREIQVHGPFVRMEALNRLAQAKFGMFFTFLGEQYGGPIENTLLEVVASGTIPIVRKVWYDAATFNNDKMVNYKPEDIGTIVYDENNPQECIDLMVKLDSDKNLYDEYVKKSYKFYKDNFDRNYILERLYKLF